MNERLKSPASHHLHGLHWSARVSALQRQGLAITGGALAAVVAPRGTAPSGEIPWLVGWLVYSLVYLAIAWRLAAQLDARATRRRAQWNDPGAAMLFGLVVCAACASIVAVALAVDTGKTLQGLARWSHLALAMASLAASWLLLQTVFALHYARVYYRLGHNDNDHPGGLVFPGNQDPEYLDFFYFSVVVGMTSQVSDVAVASRRMRHLTLVHGLLSFGFNLVVLALAVNVFAGSLA